MVDVGLLMFPSTTVMKEDALTSDGKQLVSNSRYKVERTFIVQGDIAFPSTSKELSTIVLSSWEDAGN